MVKFNNSLNFGGGGNLLKPLYNCFFGGKHSSHLEAIAERSQTNMLGILRVAQNDGGKGNCHSDESQNLIVERFGLYSGKILKPVRNDEKRNHLSAYSPIDLSTCKKKAAFTLAEVLITLGIIGVVAAMTIPNLISNTNAGRYKSQLKKTISTLSQVGKLNTARYDWSYADISEPCFNRDFMKQTSENNASICAILNSNLSGIQGIYLNGELTNRYNYNMKTYTSGFNGSGGQFTIYILKDGVIVGVRSASTSSGCEVPVGMRLGEAISKGSIWRCSGFIDVNGLTLPNEETRCSVGTLSKDIDTTCIVKNKDVKDIYPIVFYNDTVTPATNAGRFLMQSAK